MRGIGLDWAATLTIPRRLSRHPISAGGRSAFVAPGSHSLTYGVPVGAGVGVGLAVGGAGTYGFSVTYPVRAEYLELV